MVERKLDLFKLLDRISVKDTDYFRTLSETEVKEFQPFVIMRWLSGTSSKRQLYFLNAIANPVIFTLGQHKELLYYLLTVCTTGNSQRYHWIKAPKSRGRGTLATTVVAKYFNYGHRHAVDAAKLLTNDEIMAYAGELGWQKDEIAKLKKELADK